jgi:hypothetical protein
MLWTLAQHGWLMRLSRTAPHVAILPKRGMMIVIVTVVMIETEIGTIGHQSTKRGNN